MELQTKIGNLKIDENEIIRFPAGILGFTEYHDYVVVEQEGSFFSFLQSVDEPALSFVIIMPELVCCDYEVELNEEEIQLLKIDSPKDGRLYGIVTIPENVAEMTVNLQAPVVINSKERLAAQLILRDERYHTKHNVLAEMHKNAFLLHRQAEQDEVEEHNLEVRESV